MKKIVQYECEICGRRSDDKGIITACENKKSPVEYPIGCIYGTHEKDNVYEHITFAVANNEIEGGILAHINSGGSWACRDNGLGDTLGNDKCCSSSGLSLTEYDSILDHDTPHFKRMVKYLEDRDIKVTIWDGKKAILYIKDI